MKDWKLPALGISATALVIAGSIAPSSETTAGMSPAAEIGIRSMETSPAKGASDLLDPRLVAGTICRGKAARALMAPGTAPGTPQSARLQLAATRIAQAASDADPAMPLLDGLGDLSIRITTANPLAQDYFDQGLRLAYGFNHADAIRSFREAQKADPDCALCYWGEAWALGPNINVPMQPEAEEPAVRAMAAARALAPAASERERALIAALDQRYFDPTGSDPSNREDPGRAELDLRYADAMAEVHRRFPEDDDIAILYAEAMMNLSPWDYWKADRRTPKGRTAEIVSLLETIIARNPDHAAAIHLYIHMVEASDDPQRAEAHADRLGALMPAAGHIVHMPSHIYYRVGRYLDSLHANQAAIKADEALFARLRSSGVYPLAYFSHNVHFAMTSAQMAGAGETVLRAARNLDAVLPMSAAESIPLVQPIKAAPIFAMAQFGKPDDVLAIPDPGENLPYIRAIRHYARGVAQVAKGDLGAARAEAVAIERIAAQADFSSLIEALIPGPDVAALARHVLLGRIAQAEGRYDAAVDAFSAAVEIQSGLPYMEPPYWYYPVNQSLGAALLQAGRPQEAERAFRAALFEAPNSGWALYGLIETYEASSDKPAVEQTRRLFEAAWAGDPRSLTLNRL